MHRGRPQAILVPSGGIEQPWFAECEYVKLPLPSEPFDLGSRKLACRLEVDDDEAAQAALLAVMRNVALVIRLTAPETVAVEFIDQLVRVAAVEHAHDPRGDLTPEQVELLNLLSTGRSVGQAAAAMNLSLRTAHRRLEAARRVLGVETTVQAILGGSTTPHARIRGSSRLTGAQ